MFVLRAHGEGGGVNESDGQSGFVLAIGIVGIVCITIAISRCSMLASITDDCNDFGKFESIDLDAPIYECRKLSPVIPPEHRCSLNDGRVRDLRYMTDLEIAELCE